MNTDVMLITMMEDRKTRLQKRLQLLAQGYASNSDLARAMGIPIQAFGTYVRGVSFPEGENFRKIANFLQVTEDELTAQLLGIETVSKPKGSRSKEKGSKAEDIIPIAAQLPQEEKLRLVKYLINSLEPATG